jgi:hypothetical protein
MTFCIEIKKSILKYIWKHKRPRIAKAILNKKSNARGIMKPDFNLYHRALTIKTAQYWHKNRQEDQWMRIEDPDINSHIYSQVIFDKGAQNTQWRKDSLFNKCCWENWISTYGRQKLDLCLSPCTKINSKWISNVNIRPETLKQFQEVVGNILEHIGIGNDFLNRTQQAQHRRGIMKWDCIKLNGCAQQKKQLPDHRMGENLCQLLILYKTSIHNLQGTPKTQPPNNQHHNEEMDT